MKNKIEILSPAGGFDSVIAAVHSGADAVYIGSKSFSARASAHNFDDDELRECVRYCHQRGVKVHLALNTLIFDDEMPRALELVKTAAKADIDALIIQDLGLVSLIKNIVPELPLHASTQLTVHTPYGAKALYEMGFERVVVSRELSLAEIKTIHEFCPEVELEVFVHGALCMCVSGQCYFSAMLGGRSANRGMCAQPCRLPMRFGDNDHALSLKDNGSLHFLRELQEMGVASAKIEGRMKRPEYVGAATLAAREARDFGFVTEATGERLQAVFSRTGFTDGYLSGKLGESMFGYRQKSDVVSADSKLLKEIRTYYKDEYRHIPLDMSFIARTGEKMRLTVSDGEHTITVESEKTVEKAVNLPLSAERAAQSLSKTGGTPYYVNKLIGQYGNRYNDKGAGYSHYDDTGFQYLFDLILFVCSISLGDQYRSCHREALDQRHIESEGRGSASNRGKRVTADKTADHNRVDHVVDLLKDIPYKKRDCKTQNKTEGVSLGHIRS